jgi:hypothetical protein
MTTIDTTQTPLLVPERVPEQNKRRRTTKESDGDGAPVKKVKKTQTPLMLLGEEATVFHMKQRIATWQHAGSKISIPKHLRKAVRGIKGHNSVLDSTAVLDELRALYTTGLELEAIRWMAGCVVYYEAHHNITIRRRDQFVIERALTRPARVTIEKMRDLYDLYLCGMEQTHHYYSEYMRLDVKNRDMPKRPPRRCDSGNDKPKKVTKHLPYNLFIQEQWKARKEEFGIITKQENIAAVMRLLSVEWKTNPALKPEYLKKCDDMNAAVSIASPGDPVLPQSITTTAAEDDEIVTVPEETPIPGVVDPDSPTVILAADIM